MGMALLIAFPVSTGAARTLPSVRICLENYVATPLTLCLYLSRNSSIELKLASRISDKPISDPRIDLLREFAYSHSNRHYETERRAHHLTTAGVLISIAH